MDKKTIVALVALPEEYKIFQEVFPFKKDHSSQTNICLEHEVDVEDIRLISVLAEQMGAQSAANSAALAIQQFDPDMIVVVGIGGGVSKDVDIGDVCISNEIIDVLHNNKISDKNGTADISFAPNFYNIDPELIASFVFLNNHPSLSNIYNIWHKSVINEALEISQSEFENYNPKIEIGPIACGPVSSSSQFNEKLKALHRKVISIETESGGVFSQIHLSRIPAISIRGISDMADHDKTNLENRTNGSARRLAMFNAVMLLKAQLANAKFKNVSARHYQTKKQLDISLFPNEKIQTSIVSQLEKEITDRLKDLSFDFRSRPDGFYLPIPRVKRVIYTDELTGRAVNDPEGIIECIKKYESVIVRLPRAFPSHALGWSLAHSLLRHQMDGKIILPFVVNGSLIRPPLAGLENAIPESIRSATYGPEFMPIFIIEEPHFSSRSRIKFLSEEIAAVNGKILIITKSEDNVAAVDDFIRESALTEFELEPISFSETAFFLERAFDMCPREAEAVAIRLDDTFRKFNLEADPTYFAGLQEDTLAALINANKRAELIQLAVDGILSLIVAADKSKTLLSRTTRENFLKLLVLKMATTTVTDAELSAFAADFLKKFAFDRPQSEFLTLFFQLGVLYQTNGQIKFTHPYLESYLLAQALREHKELALSYFDPKIEKFNYYAFDLYCELGPDKDVVTAIIDVSEEALIAAHNEFKAPHIYSNPAELLTTLSNPKQLQYLASSLMSNAEKMERSKANDDVRVEKQQILDARRKIRKEVDSRQVVKQDNLPQEIKTEFRILDQLSRSLALCITALGSGSEALDGMTKEKIALLSLEISAKFSDVWTRNRLRINFKQARADLLADECIWKFMEDIGAESDDFDKIKNDLQLYLYSVELNTILEPMGRILWNLSSAAGVKVLEPVLRNLDITDPLQKVIRGCWYCDIDPSSGHKVLKHAMIEYKGSALLRVVLASHLLSRVFWHHYKTASSEYFVSGARRALAPIGLSPTTERLNQVKKGVSGTGDIQKKKKRKKKRSNK